MNGLGLQFTEQEKAVIDRYATVLQASLAERGGARAALGTPGSACFPDPVLMPASAVSRGRPLWNPVEVF